MAIPVEPWILVVESDDDVQQEIAHALLVEGYRVKVAEHGEAAVDRVLEHGLPYVILLDSVMPRMGARELLEIFSASKEARRIPIILLTTSSDAGELPSCFGSLLKPFALDELLEMVGRAFAVAAGGFPSESRGCVT